MAKTKSQEEILTQIYNMYCPTSWFRRDIFDKNVHNDREYIKKLNKPIVINQTGRITFEG